MLVALAHTTQHISDDCVGRWWHIAVHVHSGQWRMCADDYVPSSALGLSTFDGREFRISQIQSSTELSMLEQLFELSEEMTTRVAPSGKQTWVVNAVIQASDDEILCLPFETVDVVRCTRLTQNNIPSIALQWSTRQLIGGFAILFIIFFVIEPRSKNSQRRVSSNGIIFHAGDVWAQRWYRCRGFLL